MPLVQGNTFFLFSHDNHLMIQSWMEKLLVPLHGILMNFFLASLLHYYEC
uniref:Uncharacterized protein n=1 Tax=Rhizophora mucronata TaxID=61149 RepID=A0A2P2P705_RHIMU